MSTECAHRNPRWRGGSRSGLNLALALLTTAPWPTAPASASSTPQLTTDVGRLEHLVPSVADPGTRGRVICGLAATGIASSTGLGSTGDPNANPTAGDDLDHKFVGVGWVSTMPTAWDMGVAGRRAIVFPSVEHGPMPYEALEFTVWGCDRSAVRSTTTGTWSACQFCTDTRTCAYDPTHVCEQASLAGVYDKGWTDSGLPEESDDFASLWTFSTPHEIVVVWADRTHELVPDSPT